MLTRIDRNSIICDDIKTSTGEKYATSNAVFEAQALAETAAVNAIEAANDARNDAEEAKEITEGIKSTAQNIVNEVTANSIAELNEAVSEIKQETFNAQALAETAALEAIDAKQVVVEIKEELESKFPDGITPGTGGEGGSFDASGDITFTGQNTFTQYTTFNNGLISNSDIVLNGSKLLLANGASVELYTGEGLPIPDSNGSIDSSNFASLGGDNEFSGNNNFTGTLQTSSISIGEGELSTSEDGNLLWNGVSVENQDLSDYVTNSTLNNKGYLTSSSLSGYAKTSDLSSYATTSSLSSYLKSSDVKGYVSSSAKSTSGWYIKYSNGLILQGGSLSATTNITTITFSTPFSSIPSVYLTRATTRGQGSYDNELYPYTISNSNFSYKMNPTEVSNATWFAIGY